MMGADRKTMLTAMRGECCNNAEWKALVGAAEVFQLRSVIRDCCLTASSLSCNRTRVGLLVNELVDRVERAERRTQEALDRANAAEAKLAGLGDALQTPVAPAVKPQSAKKGRGKR